MATKESKAFSGDAPLEGIEWFNNDSFDPNRIRVEHVEQVAGVTLLDNVLTPEECTRIITGTFSEKGDKVPGTAKPVLFRGWSENPEEELKKLGKRIFFASKDFSDKLWHRVRPHVPETMKVVLGETQTEWKVTGMSDRIRFVRYETGQEFPAHMDASEVQDNNNRSFLSILFYMELPSVPKRGGELRFLKATSMVDTEKVVDISIRSGLVIIMPHKTLHMSVPIIEGFKFLIRSNLLYTRVPDSDVKVAPGTPNEPAFASY